MKKLLAVFFVMVISVGLVGNAFAHKSEVVGDYKIGVGWKNEPPVVGVENSVEVVITMATDFDKASKKESSHEESHEETHDEHDDSMHEEHKDEMTHESKETKPGEGVSGLANSIEATITLGEEKTQLTLVESSTPGIYHSKYTPQSAGHPVVDLFGEIGHTQIGLTFHPEKVESKSMLAPLKQLQSGIAPDKIQCKDGMELISKASTGEPACVRHETAERLVELGWALI